MCHHIMAGMEILNQITTAVANIMSITNWPILTIREAFTSSIYHCTKQVSTID